MQQKSGSLQARLDDIERRLRSFRTVTNTASAEITGGETVIDEDGSIIFSDGGRLVLGESSIKSYDGTELIDSDGNLKVDSLIVYGDVLSASDYHYQREAIEDDIVNTNVIAPIDQRTELEFPDWSSSALVVFTVYIKARFRNSEHNPLTIYLNGKPISRPKSDVLGNVILDSTVVRRMSPENPTIHLTIDITDDVAPVADPEIRVSIGGVYSI